MQCAAFKLHAARVIDHLRLRVAPLQVSIPDGNSDRVIGGELSRRNELRDAFQEGSDG